MSAVASFKAFAHQLGLKTSSLTFARFAALIKIKRVHQGAVLFHDFGPIHHLRELAFL